MHLVDMPTRESRSMKCFNEKRHEIQIYRTSLPRLRYKLCTLSAQEAVQQRSQVTVLGKVRDAPSGRITTAIGRTDFAGEAAFAMVVPCQFLADRHDRFWRHSTCKKRQFFVVSGTSMQVRN